MKFFYSHLIEIESVIIKLDEMELSEEQKLHLTTLVNSTIHHQVLDFVLSQLSEDDKLIFLSRLQDNPNELENQQLMKFLTEKVTGIEDGIRKVVVDLKKQLHEDIKEAQKHG